PLPHDSTDDILITSLAKSLAAAQDCVERLHHSKIATGNIVLFKSLWEATVNTLTELIESGDLDPEAFGWGIMGLSSGYIGQDSLFLSYKTRLQNALQFLPSMDNPARKWSEYRNQMKLAATKIQVLVTIRGEVHFCSIMLLQRFKQEDWRRIRWYHGIAVAERWAGSLGL
ncbi:hypothetical protein BKA66DRAFT_394671, partial [Pyrenochaeta sp. MPI-SDFR-AT-0127]